jgi:hypothetical protein
MIPFRCVEVNFVSVVSETGLTFLIGSQEKIKISNYNSFAHPFSGKTRFDPQKRTQHGEITLKNIFVS